jgi:ribosomal protein S2
VCTSGTRPAGGPPDEEIYLRREKENGIHIIDLQKTIAAIKEASRSYARTVHDGKPVLFVGTKKKQAQAAIEREAKRCGMYFVNNRWLGACSRTFPPSRNPPEAEKDREDGSRRHLSRASQRKRSPSCLGAQQARETSEGSRR